MEIHLTVDELVETLKRSSLTTILVEGKDDVIVYRWIEQEIGFNKANFLPCGGRGQLLKVFERRSEFKNIKTIFIADKDCFVYDEKVPDKYKEIIWTNGYSIENDLYCGSAVEKLLDPNEKTKFNTALNNFVFYYSYEVDNYLKEIEYNFASHPREVLTDDHEVCSKFLEGKDFIEPPEEIIDKIKKNYEILIRGKSLFALLLRFLSHKKRPVKHSKKSLMEYCYKVNRGALMEVMIKNINYKLSL